MILLVATWVAALMLAAAIVLGLWRVVSACDGASQAIVGDLVFFSTVAMLVLLGIVGESAAVVDAALLASLVGVLATVAMARIVTRGRR